MSEQVQQDYSPYIRQPYLEPLISTGDTERVQDHLRKPVSANELIGQLGFAAASADNPGMTTIVRDLASAQHMPSYPPKVVDKKAPGKDHLKVPGRVVEITYQSAHDTGQNQTEPVTIFAADKNHSNGRVWVQAEVSSKLHTPLGTPETPMRHAYAIFLYDPKAPNQAHEINPAYKDGTLEKGDWRLVDVVDDQRLRTDTGYFLALHKAKPLQATLSMLAPIELAKHVQEYVRNFDEGRLLGHVGALIDVFHRTYHLPQDYDYTKDKNLHEDSIDFIGKFELACIAAPELIATPLRAWEVLAVQSRALHSGSISEREFARAEREVYRDVLQAWAMTRVRANGASYAEFRASPEGADTNSINANPVRYTVQLRDGLLGDVENRVISRLRGAGALTLAAQDYLETISKLPPESALSIMPTPGNGLWCSTGMWDELERADHYAHSPDVSMPYRAEGVYYKEAVASLYTHGSILQLGGMVARLETDIELNVGPRDQALVVDLMQAPSALLRSVVEGGHFNGKTAVDMGHPTLSGMLLAPQPAELVLGVYEKDNDNAEEKSISILGEIGVDGTCHLIGKQQTTGGRTVVGAVRVAIEHQEGNTRNSRRWARKKSSKRSPLAGPSNGLQLGDDETLIASLGLKGGGLQLRTGPLDDSVFVRMMRNAGPLSMINYA